MQTFLPYADFRRTARVLDDRRLGKQRVETLQILRALHFDDYGWRNHPAVMMWRGHAPALVGYGDVVTQEWVRRGHADTVRPQIAEFVAPAGPIEQPRLATAGLLPPWLGWEPLHVSHRAALVRKDPVVYGPLFPDADPRHPYVWPPPPPPASPDTRPPSAWVVRPAAADMVSAFVTDGLVGIPLPSSARARKRQREVSKLVDDVAIGARVLTPLSPASLLLGTVTGQPRRAVVTHSPAVVRDVAWEEELDRSALRWPAALQNPGLVFPLRGEERALARR